jgi:hypothetical protein
MTSAMTVNCDMSTNCTAYAAAEILHYNDGRAVATRVKVRPMEPARAVDVTHLPGHPDGRVAFWFDHDPRIVAITYTYAQL